MRTPVGAIARHVDENAVTTDAAVAVAEALARPRP
jgi:hypothetical protein